MSYADGVRATDDLARPLAEAVLGEPVRFSELKRKPGRRRTTRAVGPRGSAIVKAYATARAPVVAARLEALAGGPPEPVLPKVLLVDPGLRLVVLSEVPGEPLRDSLLRGDESACARAGAALAAWHGFWHGARPEALRPHTAEREVQILLARAAGACPSTAAAVESLAPPLAGEWPPTTAVHRDLYEDQVLVDERIGLVDLDDAALGPPELDLGNLLAHAELLALHAGGAGRAASEGATALLGAYRSGAPGLDDELLDRCRALALLRLACIHGEHRLIGIATGAWMEVGRS